MFNRHPGFHFGSTGTETHHRRLCDNFPRLLRSGFVHAEQHPASHLEGPIFSRSSEGDVILIDSIQEANCVMIDGPKVLSVMINTSYIVQVFESIPSHAEWHLQDPLPSTALGHTSHSTSDSGKVAMSERPSRETQASIHRRSSSAKSSCSPTPPEDSDWLRPGTDCQVCARSGHDTNEQAEDRFRKAN